MNYPRLVKIEKRDLGQFVTGRGSFPETQELLLISVFDKSYVIHEEHIKSLSQLFIDTENARLFFNIKPWDMEYEEVVDVIQYYISNNLKTPKKEKVMEKFNEILAEMEIEEIVFKPLGLRVLKKRIKDLEKIIPDIEIDFEKDKIFIVNGGDEFEIDPENFMEQFIPDIKGKTIKELLCEDFIMSLIQTIGVIKRISFKMKKRSLKTVLSS